MIRSYLVIVALATISPSVFADASTDFAKKGRAAWAAFECSSLASVLEKPKEQERLFQLGYDQGKSFFNAWQSGQITKNDLNSNTPLALLLIAQGPTIDFILGRVFESAQENALKDVITSESVLNKELKQTLASNKYTSSNCEIIGNGR